MNNVLIDGEIKNSDDVNPSIHVWIGSFRPPIDKVGYYCKVHYQDYLYAHQLQENYIKGYYDIPQYKTFNDSDWLEKFKEGAQKIILELAEEVEKQRLK